MIGWSDSKPEVRALEQRVAQLEDTIRVLLTQNHLGEKLPYAEYRRLWDALPPAAALNHSEAPGEHGNQQRVGD